MARFSLSETELRHIEEAVHEAEKSTSGEIATAIVRESDDYAFQELVFALVVGFVWYIAVMAFYTPISSWLARLVWAAAPWHMPLFMGTTTVAVIGVVYLLANIAGFDRLIVRRAIMARKVEARAFQHFAESGLANTRDRTGILLFVSARERRVHLIADQGINDRVPPGTWDELVAQLVGQIRAGKVAAGLEEAVTSCGAILEEHFPIKPDDENELADGVQLLED
jgi:putative membrane protein